MFKRSKISSQYNVSRLYVQGARYVNWSYEGTRCFSVQTGRSRRSRGPTSSSIDYGPPLALTMTPNVKYHNCLTALAGRCCLTACSDMLTSKHTDGSPVLRWGMGRRGAVSAPWYGVKAFKGHRWQIFLNLTLAG